MGAIFIIFSAYSQQESIFCQRIADMCAVLCDLDWSVQKYSKTYIIIKMQNISKWQEICVIETYCVNYEKN